MWMPQYEEKEKDHRLTRATPSIQMLENSEGARHTEVNSTNGVSGDRIQTHVDGVSAAQAPDLHLGSHVHSLQGDHPQALPL